MPSVSIIETHSLSNNIFDFAQMLDMHCNVYFSSSNYVLMKFTRLQRFWWGFNVRMKCDCIRTLCVTVE